MHSNIQGLLGFDTPRVLTCKVCTLFSECPGFFQNCREEYLPYKIKPLDYVKKKIFAFLGKDFSRDQVAGLDLRVGFP
jgi:hypothetical protein